MNLIDAIKSGRWFGRPRVKSQNVAGIKYPFRAQEDGRIAGPNGYVEVWRTEDLLADDWETVEPTVTITRAQFWEAYCHAQKAEGARSELVGQQHGGYSFSAVNFMFSELARKLGLEGE